MKKFNHFRVYTYGFIGLISLTTLIGATTYAQTPFFTNTNTVDSKVDSKTSPAQTTFIWPTQGLISQNFHKYHEGIDIAGASGTPIVAAASGTVIKAGWDDWGLGNAIEIKHDDGSITIYGHNRRLLVSKGQKITQGQMIAEMGSTGNSTAPHLHFELLPDGDLATNPRSLLPPLIAGKIPTTQIAKSPSQDSQLRNYTSPREQSTVARRLDPDNRISVSTPSTKTDASCHGFSLIEGETPKSRVTLCKENGRFFYIGQLKQNPTQVIKLPAWDTGNNRYQANNGSFSYLVHPLGVEIWRQGRLLRSDKFYTSYNY